MPTASRELESNRTRKTASRNGLLENYFYFLMSLLISGIVVYGFSYRLVKT